MRELVQWQKIDPSNGRVFPWFTHPFLQVLERWDLYEKKVLEYGGGRSTAWWLDKCSNVVTIDHNLDWIRAIKQEVEECKLQDVWIPYYVPSKEGDDAIRDIYVKAGDKHGPYDIIVVDGIHRFECMLHGIELLLERGGILIVDNWHQDGFMCPACEELVRGYEGYIFPQEDHVDHHGNCWKTAYFIIPSEA